MYLNTKEVKYFIGNVSDEKYWANTYNFFWQLIHLSSNLSVVHAFPFNIFPLLKIWFLLARNKHISRICRVLLILLNFTKESYKSLMKNSLHEQFSLSFFDLHYTQYTYNAQCVSEWVCSIFPILLVCSIFCLLKRLFFNGTITRRLSVFFLRCASFPWQKSKVLWIDMNKSTKNQQKVKKVLSTKKLILKIEEEEESSACLAAHLSGRLIHNIIWYD